MPTALGATPSRLPSRWKSCCFVAIRKSWTPTSRTTSGAFRRPLEVGGRRIVDRRVLHLIKMWLDCPVEETDKRGRKALVQMAAADKLHWRAELAEVVDGQAEGGSGAVRGSPLRPRSHHLVRARQVRTGLPAGEDEIRTVSPPSKTDGLLTVFAGESRSTSGDRYGECLQTRRSGAGVVSRGSKLQSWRSVGPWASGAFPRKHRGKLIDLV
jgi:hypothetical protein